MPITYSVIIKITSEQWFFDIKFHYMKLETIIYRKRKLYTLIDDYGILYPSCTGDNHEQTTLSKARSKQAQLEQPQIAECGICLTPAESSDEGFQLACSHRFCRNCWRHYLTHSILDEGRWVSSTLHISYHKCWPISQLPNNEIPSSPNKVRIQTLSSSVPIRIISVANTIKF